MIKLEKNFTPICLRPAEEARLASLYAANGTRVWAAQEIVSALKETSRNKCAYCEARLGVESHYLEVDHFEHKDLYPSKVATWDNLIPSCRRCNGTKHIHDVRTDPIINPYKDDPRDHMGFRDYRYRARTALGKSSIGALDLNNSERAVKARFDIGEQVHQSLINCVEKLENFIKTRTTLRRNRILSAVRSILLECQPCAAYAATTAYVVHNDENYQSIISQMKIEELWDEEFEAMHQSSLSLVLFDGMVMAAARAQVAATA